MKIIIFSDIHGNLEALQAALDLIKKYPEALVYSLGDIVGYGANPSECLEEVRKRAIVSLAGNHDYAALGLTDKSYFNPYALKAVLWTESHLSEEDKGYLRGLPIYKEFPGRFFLVHSTPHEPENWDYILSIPDAKKHFSYFEAPICFIGHSHVPMVVESGPKNPHFMEIMDPIPLKAAHRYIINVGSIGQPRDGDWRGCLLIYDDETKTIEFKRFEYDLSTAQAKIRQVGLPDFLAVRLEYGR